ncbi:hypothetical protein CRE_04376 [Caenorhabditis remanei]|uniref:SelT-like protein n=1 Tax=Caenorhabditis remanei TaxID=31234 RepID=E3NJE5_CAERE|nr:hypothetical protein CRE_04376 [Caenorhabditis remanei]
MSAWMTWLAGMEIKTMNDKDSSNLEECRERVFSSSEYFASCRFVMFSECADDFNNAPKSIFQNSITFSAEETKIETDIGGDSKIPVPIKSEIQDGMPTVKILYCVSCGYRKAFDQFSEFAREKYPDISIEGDNFSPVYWKSQLVTVIGILKVVLSVIIMSGSNPFESLGFGYPGFLQYAHSNKLASGFLIYLLVNMLESNLSATGAFEIYVGGVQVWSKIETGRVPSQEEFLEILGKMESTK